MSRATKPKLLCLAIALVCLVILVPVQSRIDALRESLAEKKEMPRQIPVAAAAAAVLGGFRGIAVDILWVQADTMMNNKQYYQLATLYEMISTLQPNFPSVWEFNAWNLAFNISVEWGRVEEKWDWIKQGIKFAEKGFELNPDSASLAFYVAFLYGRKVNTETYFIKRLREEEGVSHWERCATYAQIAADLAQGKGDSALRERALAYQALFQFGREIVALGNLAEASDIFDKAEEGATVLLGEFPEDLAVRKLVLDIRAEKRKYGL
ncbi:MAG: hypothetical protein ACYTAN_11115 [Planctomycetota bacterium]|jgi:hypothetical protein